VHENGIAQRSAALRVVPAGLRYPVELPRII
jgi:hypothetical protein